MKKTLMSNLMKLFLVLTIMTSMIGVAGVNIVHAATQATYYVDFTNGSDSNDGLTLGTAFQSIEKARDVVRTVNSNMTGDIEILIRGGSYYVSNTINFDGADSGTNGYKIRYKAYNNEEVILTGGSAVTGWTLHDSAKNIYKASVGTIEFRQLYVDGDMATRARTPNKTDEFDFGPYYKTISFDNIDYTMKINKSDIANWSGFNKVEMVLQPHWYHANIHLDSYTTDSSYAYVSFNPNETDWAFNKASYNPQFYYNNSFHYENSYDFIDIAGEWFLDTGADMVYYKADTGQDMSSALIEVPSTDAAQLVCVKGTETNLVKGIEFIGLTFKYSNWALPNERGANFTQFTQSVDYEYNHDGIDKYYPEPAVLVEYAENIKFEDNIFRDIALDGLGLRRGVKYSEIRGNVFYNTMGTSIMLDYFKTLNPSDPPVPYRTPEEQVSNILIANNYITKFGQQYTSGGGIGALRVDSTTIEHNEVSYGPYSGMQIGNHPWNPPWDDYGQNNNTVRYNHVHHTAQLHDDGGGIYTLATQHGTEVYENYVHDIYRDKWAMTYPVAALYADNYTKGITWRDNVTRHYDGMIYEQNGVKVGDNIWSNNVNWNPKIEANAGLQSSYVNIKSGYAPANDIDITITTARAEAENMKIEYAEIENDVMYSSGKAIKATVKDTTRLTYTYGGTSGYFDMDVAYLASSGGNPVYRLYLNGELEEIFIAENGSNEIKVKTIKNVSLANGDEVRIEADNDGLAHAVLDYVELSTEAAPAATNVLPVARWRMEGDYLDGISSHDGVTEGGIVWNFDFYDSVEGKQALKLKGDNEFVNVKNHDDFNFTKDFTISIWAKPDSVSGQKTVLSKVTDYANKQYALSIVDGILKFDYEASGNDYSLSGGTLVNNEWQHIAVTVDANLNVKMYINGVNIVSDVAPAETNMSSEDLVIGRFGGTYDSFVYGGRLDDIRLYNISLSATEILKIHNETLGIENVIKEDSEWLFEYNTNDSIGSNDGVLYGNAVYSTDSVEGSNSLEFDGTDDFIEVANTASINMTKNYSITGWIKLDNTSGSNQMVSKVTDHADKQYALEVRDGVLRFDYERSSNNWFIQGGTITANAWHHIAVTIDEGLNVKLYVDAVEVASGTAPAETIPTNEPLCIGLLGGTYDINFLDGKMDAVGLFNTILTALEVEQKFIEGRKLVSNWMFEDNANDNVGTNDGVLYGSAVYSTDSVEGLKSLEFDGTDDFVEVANTATLNLTKNLSVTGWIKLDDAAGLNQLVSKVTDHADKQYALAVRDGVLVLDYEKASNNWNIEGGTIVANVWHHVAVTIDRSLNVKLYVDGIMVASGTAPAETNTTSEPVFIGKLGGTYNSNYFNGKIDDLNFYYGVLNSDEVQALAR